MNRTQIAQLFLVLFSIFMASGVLYFDEESLSLDTFFSIHPAYDHQTPFELIMASLAYTQQVGGLILAHRSAKMKDRRIATARVIIAMVLIVSGGFTFKILVGLKNMARAQIP